MKGGAAHVVPLTGDMLALLAALPRFEGGDFLFSSSAGKRPVSDFSDVKVRLDRRMLRCWQAIGRASGKDRRAAKIPGWVVHDIRRTMRTHLSALPVQDVVRELVLAHAPGLHKVYDLFAYLDEKRRCLELWNVRLKAIVAPVAANVVSLKRATMLKSGPDPVLRTPTGPANRQGDSDGDCWHCIYHCGLAGRKGSGSLTLGNGCRAIAGGGDRTGGSRAGPKHTDGAFTTAQQVFFGRCEQELRELLEDGALVLVGYRAGQPEPLDRLLIPSLLFDFDGNVAWLFDGTVYLSCRIYALKPPSPPPPVMPVKIIEPVVLVQEQRGRDGDILKAADEEFPNGWRAVRPKTLVVNRVLNRMDWGTDKRDRVLRALGWRKG